MKTKVSLLFALLLSVVSVAQIFTRDGIEYQFISQNAVAVLGRAPGNGSSSITIPEIIEASNGQILSVRRIVDSAFEGDGLVSVTIEGDRLILIERDAFRNNNLNSIHLPSTVLEISQDAFRDNVNLMDVTLGNSLTTLGPGAFRNADVRDITLPATMTDIANAVFRDNTGLRSITALGTTPANISTSGVDNDSFRDRSVINLTVPAGAEAAYANNDWTDFFSVNGQYTGPTGGTFTATNGFTYRFLSGNPNRVSITDNSNTGAIVIGPVLQTGGVFFDVVELEQDAFRGNNITSVTLPNTLITIGRGAFFQNQITSVTIPNSVIIIDQDAFRDNVTLTDVTLGNSVAILGAGAFRNAAIIEITLPASITTIENGVFRDNDTLRVIDALGTTPATVVTGGGDTDSFGNRSVIGLTVPVESVALYNASGWEGFFSVNGVFGGELGDEFINNNITYKVTARGLPNTAHIVNNTNTGVLNIPGLVTQSSADFNIVEIEVDAFRDNDLTSVTIPNSVVHIRTDAFRDNTALTDVTLGNSVATLGPGAFRNADVRGITLPASMIDLNNAVFRDNAELNVVTVLGTTPASIENSGNDNDSFGNRSDVGVIFPDGLETIYANAGWTGFFSVNGVYTGPIGNTRRLINNAGEERTFRWTASVPNEANLISLDNDSGEIENFTVRNSVNFRGATFAVKNIENNAVRNKGISSVTIENGIVDIGIDAFRDNDLTSVTIPNSVVVIRTDAFRDNTALTDVTLGNRVRALGPGAFRNADVAEIILPASMESIANAVFRDNENLIKVTALGTTPASIVTSGIDNDSFRDRSQIDLIVPEGTEQAYLDAGWINFNSITEFTVDITVAPKVFLQGASLNPITGEEDLMRDSLRENGLLPTTSPYGDGATVNPTVFTTTGANAIVDWVRIELRTGVDSDNTTIVNSKAALLQRDGDIVDLDGSSNITFTEEDGDYFIAIIHRNHIGILAAVPAPLSNQATALDFTQDVTSAKGENLALTTLVNGTFAMIAGDADGSSQILNTDITEGLTLAGGGEGYSSADADMNGFVLNSDIQLLILGNSGTVQQFE